MNQPGVSFRIPHALLAAALSLLVLPAGAGPRKAPARKPAPVKTPAPPAFLKDAASVEILPASFIMDGPRARQRLIVTATLKDGTVHDVTESAAFAVSNPAVLRVAGGAALPAADGQSRITAKIGKLVSPPTDVTIRNAKAPVVTEFVNDIMPIMAKTGCNATACHGSPAGKGGFKLSLFGYEPELDHPAIVKDGKRADLKDPAKSLFLTKPTMQSPHAGGMRFKVNSPEYRTILGWLKEGAPGLGEFEAVVKQVMVVPDQPWMPGPGKKQRLAVTAVMSDGSTKDVTEKALFTSNDDAIAEVSDDGFVTARRPGETAVMVRYLGQVAMARVAVLPPWKLARYPNLVKNNYIDDLVQAKLEKLRVVPSDLCTDEEFVRRVWLDVCGIIPTADEARRFVADRSSGKRAALIDRLLEREEFVDLWTMKWNDTLRNNFRLTRNGAVDYAKWIREQVAKNRPFDEFARQLITSEGRNTSDPTIPPNQQDRPGIDRQLALIKQVPFAPESNYFVVSPDPLDVTSATSQIFMGVRIECSRCHNHPFERWTQSDYYGLAAFFSGLQVRGQQQIGRLITMNDRAPGPRHPKTNEVVEPKTLDNAEIKLERGTDKRAVLAEWMTAPTNPYFARAAANRIWGHYLGRGIVEPIDDIRVTNPAANPALLDALAKDLADHKFDLKHIHRTILNSHTYQQSSKPNQFNRQDSTNFARFYPKRMMAEQIFDSISQATGIYLTPPAAGPLRRRFGDQAQQALPRQLRDLVAGEGLNRVMQIPVAGFRPGGGGGQRGGEFNAFLEAFGKPRREVVCECERSADGSMGQALMLINGPEINAKISSPFGRVQQLIRSNAPLPAAVEDLYVATLSRRPNAGEMEEAGVLLRSSRTAAEGLEDLMWSLLNSREFLFNH